MPLSPLTVLFGPNGAGKSNILEALAAALGGAELARRPPEDAPGAQPGVTFFLRLTDVGVAGSPDSQRLVGCLRADERRLAEWKDTLSTKEWRELQAAGDALRVLGYDVDAFAGPTLALPAELEDPSALVGAVAEQLVGDCPVQTAAAARDFVAGLLSDPLLAVAGGQAWLAVDRRAAPRLRDARERLLNTAAVDDHALGTWARAADPDLPGERYTKLQLVSRCGGRGLIRALGGVVSVRGEPEGLEEEVERWLPQLFAHYWTKALCQQRGWEDIWLVEVESEEGGPAVQLRPQLVAVVQELTARSNTIAPRFVQREGDIQIAIRPIGSWHRTGRVSVHLVLRDTGLRLPESLLGAGTRRWVAACVRRAVAELSAARANRLVNRAQGAILEGELTEFDDDGDETFIPEAWDLLDEPYSDTTDVAVGFDYAPAPGILLVDEPEAHLHPLAQGDVAAWLAERGQAGSTVIAASHARALLELQADHTLVQVVRRDGATMAVPLGPSFESLRQLLADCGYSKVDLLQLARLVLVVEGTQDMQVISHFYDADLGHARVIVLPLHGTDNTQALIDAEWLAQARLPLRVLFDGTRAHRLHDPKPQTGDTKEEQAARKLLARRRQGMDVDVVAFDDPDVIFALPEQAVRQAYPDADFRDWDHLIGRWRAQQQAENFKVFALRCMGLPPDARRFITRVLQRAGDAHPRPALHRAIEEVLAAAVAGA